MKNILAKLRQRQVFKVATIYAVSAWPLIQIADLAVPALGLPDSVMTMLLQIFLVGFPISLIFAWLFNFTAKGIVRANEEVEQSLVGEQSTSQVNVQTTLAITGSLVVAVLAFLSIQWFLTDKSDTVKPVELVTSPLNVTKPAPVSVGLTLPVKKKESIAILPFVPFSQDPADEYFADGMVEELLNLLAKIPDLQVAARTSSFAYKGVSNKTIVDIGKELGVETILEGSIRKNDVTNKIRVTAQLIKVSTGEHLWSETFDREYRDIFQIQDDIASAVVNKMKITLLGEEQQSPFIAQTLSVDAMVAYGKGKQELTHRTAPSLNKALNHFKQAIREDENYARAYVGVADANILLALYSNTSKSAAKEQAQAALEKALSLNNNLGEAYASLGLLWSVADSTKAELYFKQAMALTPNYAMTYMWYGSLLKRRGGPAQSQELFKRALELDPKSPIAAYNVASGYYELGNEDKAMELFSQIIANDPYYPSAYNLVGDILMNRGRLDEAITMYKRALDVDEVNQDALRGLLTATMDMGDFAATQKWFDYITSKEELFSLRNIQLLTARFYAAQGQYQKSISLFSNIKLSAESDVIDQYLLAEAAFYRKDYALSASYYRATQKPNGATKNGFYYLDDGQAAIHSAFTYKQLEQNTAANELINDYFNFLQQTQNKRNNNPNYYYKMALVKALQQKNDEALYYLQAAIDAGWVRVWQAEIEPVLAHLSNGPQFQQMLGGIKARLSMMRSRANNQETFLLADSDSEESFR